MSKHTPGPWEITERLDIVAELEGEGNGWLEICGVFKDFVNEDIAKANANLIAAAPDMLEALKLARNDSYTNGAVRVVLDEAIAKAKEVRI